MKQLIIKSRLGTGLVFAGLIEVVFGLLYMALSKSLAPGESGGGWYTFAKMGLWLDGMAIVGLILSYLLIPRFFGMPREEEVNDPAPTVMDPARDVATSGSVQKAGISGSWVLLGGLLLIATLGSVLFIHHAKNPSVFEIVEHGTCEQLDAILLANPDTINEKNKDGMSLLMVAIQNGRLDMVEMLITSGADLNAMDRTGQSVLVRSLENPDLVERLLQKGAELNAVDSKGMSPLHWAIQRQYKDSVRLLLQYGANANRRNGEGDTPLLMAVRSRFDIVDLLLMHGANPNLADQIGETPLHVAAEHDDIESVQALIAAHAERSPISMQGWTPLHLASLNGSLSVVALLLQSHVDVDVENKRSQTPLTCAIQKNQIQIVEYLLKNGADINRVDRYGNTYLHMALEERHYDLAAVLVQAGVDLDIANDAGVTTRQLLQSSGHEKLLEMSRIAGVQ